MQAGSMLGNAVMRREDPALLKGESRYVGDMTPEGTMHLAFVRSVMAHATVSVVDTSDALAVEGVVAVFTSSQLDLDPQSMFVLLPPTLKRPPLVDGVARYVGDPIAVVVAETRAAAVDAAELVVVDYDPLPALVDPAEALAEDAPVIIEAHGSNRALEFNKEADPAALGGYDLVVRGRFVNQRVAGGPIEPTCVLAVPGGQGADEHELTVYCSSQAPHGARVAVADAVGLAHDKVRVIAPAVGGGFGPKAYHYPEFMVAARVAQRFGRPAKWVETRSENLTNMCQGRDQLHECEMGVTGDGRIAWMRQNVVADVGAYPGVGAFLPFFTMTMASGPYQIPEVDFRSVGVITNKPPTGAFRGAGRPEATVNLERMMDMVALELNMDPAEVRRRNLLAPGDFPLTTPTGANMDCGEYERALDLALSNAGYDELRAEQRRRREAGDRVLMGIGVSVYVEVTAVGLFTEYGSVTVELDGTITARVGTASHGQGHVTAFTQIVSEVLGVDAERVRVIHSDTAEVPRGTGTVASRSLQIGGSAVWTTAHEVLDQARRLAAGLLEADEGDIVTAPGGLAVAGVPARTITWAELAEAAASAPSAAGGDDGDDAGGDAGGLFAETDFNQGEASYPFGAHVCVVEIDSDTGDTRVVRHVAVDDCGRILNPLLVRGQVHGGVATGISQALYEELTFDEDGNPRNTNFADYSIPAASELPRYETAHTETPSPLNPLGAKGIGESGTIGSTPAVQSAVIDALAPYGVRHLDMPFTPQRVWRALRDAKSNS